MAGFARVWVTAANEDRGSFWLLQWREREPDRQRRVWCTVDLSGVAPAAGHALSVDDAADLELALRKGALLAPLDEPRR